MPDSTAHARCAPAGCPCDTGSADDEIEHDVRRDTAGRRIDDEYVDRLVSASRKPGRPALAADGPSPSIAFRVPAALREQAEELAAREGKTVSQLAREALEARLAAS